MQSTPSWTWDTWQQDPQSPQRSGAETPRHGSPNAPTSSAEITPKKPVSNEPGFQHTDLGYDESHFFSSSMSQSMPSMLSLPQLEIPTDQEFKPQSLTFSPALRFTSLQDAADDKPRHRLGNLSNSMLLSFTSSEDLESNKLLQSFVGTTDEVNSVPLTRRYNQPSSNLNVQTTSPSARSHLLAESFPNAFEDYEARNVLRRPGPFGSFRLFSNHSLPNHTRKLSRSRNSLQQENERKRQKPLPKETIIGLSRNTSIESIHDQNGRRRFGVPHINLRRFKRFNGIERRLRSYFKLGAKHKRSKAPLSATSGSLSSLASELDRLLASGDVDDVADTTNGSSSREEHCISLGEYCASELCLFQDILSDLARVEPSLLHEVTSFLDVRDAVALSTLSKQVCAGLRGCPLRLDQLPKTISFPLLTHYFGESVFAAAPATHWSMLQLHSNNKASMLRSEHLAKCSRFEKSHGSLDTEIRRTRLTSWKITGIRMGYGLPFPLFWKYLDLARLESLTLVGAWPALNFGFLHVTPMLKHFECTRCSKRVMHVEALKQCVRLKHVTLNNCSSLVKTEDFLPKSKHLTTLCLKNAKNLTDISSLTYLTGLKHLDLSGCTNLVNLNPLVACQELETLKLTDCAKVTQIQAVSKLQKLSCLEVVGCKGIRSFLPLVLCSSLQTVSMKHCSPRALAMLLNLKYLLPMRALQLESSFLLSNIPGESRAEEFCIAIRGAVGQALRSEAANCLKLCSFQEMIGSLDLLISYVAEAPNVVEAQQQEAAEDMVLCDVLCELLDIFSCMTLSDTEISDGDWDVLCEQLIPPLQGLVQCLYSFEEDEESNGLSFTPDQLSAAKLCKSVSSVLAHLANNRETVVRLVDAGFIPAIFHFLNVRGNFLAFPEVESDNKEEFLVLLDEIEESAASSLLLIALVEQCRTEIASEENSFRMKSLVKILFSGTDNASIEAAGAIWNVAASLDIGKVVVHNDEYRCVEALLYTIKNRPMKAKTQAIGAIRNLAILDENKPKLLKHNIIKSIVEMVNGLLHGEEVKQEPVFFSSMNTVKLLLLQEKLNGFSEEARVLLCKCLATLRILAAYSSNENEAQQQCAEFGAIDLFLGFLALYRLGASAASSSTERSFLGMETEVLVDCTGGLLALSFMDENREKIGTLSALKDIIFLIKYSSVDTVVVSCCGCLWNLAMNDDLERKIVACNAIPVLVSRIQHPNQQVVAKAVGALKNLSYQAEHKQIVFSCGGDAELLKKLESIKNQATSVRMIVTGVGLKMICYILGALKLLSLGTLEGKHSLIEKNVVRIVADFLDYESVLSVSSHAQSKDASREACDTLRYAVGILLNVSEVLLVHSSLVASAAFDQGPIRILFVRQLTVTGACDRLAAIVNSAHPVISKAVKGDAREVLRRTDQVSMFQDFYTNAS